MRILISDGGGMRNTFTAGVLAGFRDAGIKPSFFDKYIGSSGGACSMTYFMAGQVDEGLRIWQDHLPGKFMKWRGLRPYNDTEYLDHVFRNIEPLACEVIRARQERVIVALTDLLAGEPAYKAVHESDDPIRLLVASATMPFFANPVVLNGRPFCDSNCICSIPLRCPEVAHATETWIILTTPHGYRRKSFRWRVGARLFSIFGGEHGLLLGKLLANRPHVENEVLAEIEKRRDFVVIRPERSLSVSFRSNNSEGIRVNIELGRQAAYRAIAQLSSDRA